ncbi:hypothetical protein [Leifsonia sp. NCR5]|uniref:hypothetical protein n=1 Tax=Leifsonia sp. NCR5 TaxID=1978342 RepID=UPI00117AC4E3|nr:hypothetical protein [Leifsonia sp. NCR5]
MPGITVAWAEAERLGDISWQASLVDLIGELNADYEVRFALQGEPVNVLVVGYRASDHPSVAAGRRVAEQVYRCRLEDLDAVALVACDRCEPALLVDPIRDLLKQQVPDHVTFATGYRADSAGELSYHLRQFLLTYIGQKNLTGLSLTRRERSTMRGDDF